MSVAIAVRTQVDPLALPRVRLRKTATNTTPDSGCGEFPDWCGFPATLPITTRCYRGYRISVIGRELYQQAKSGPIHDFLDAGAIFHERFTRSPAGFAGHYWRRGNSSRTPQFVVKTPHQQHRRTGPRPGVEAAHHNTPDDLATNDSTRDHNAATDGPADDRAPADRTANDVAANNRATDDRTANDVAANNRATDDRTANDVAVNNRATDNGTTHDCAANDGATHD